MKLAFRCDASEKIGTGHVMRCLTLARAAVAEGHDVRFFVGDADSGLTQRIADDGIGIQWLRLRHDSRAKTVSTGESNSSAIEDVYELDQQINEATTFLKACVEFNPDWVVVDHYGYGDGWISSVKRAGYAVLLVEDWPHRAVNADLLLDPRPGADPMDYAGYTVTDKVICGSSYNLIRNEFFESSCAPVSEVKRVLINLGGYDRCGFSAGILDVLAEEALFHSLEFTVLLSESSPAYARIQNTTYPFPVRLIECCDDMSELYRAHDVCIGAAGGSLWERTAMQLPTALVIVADNQQPQADFAEQSGLVKLVADFRTLDAQSDVNTVFDVSTFRQLIESPELCRSMQSEAGGVLTGSGSRHILECMRDTAPEGLTLRAATLNDMREFYSWQKQPGARRFFRNPSLPRWHQHMIWYRRVLSDSRTRLYIISYRGGNAGYARIDGSEVSILISRKYRGNGLAVKALQSLVSRHPGTRFYADVAPGNLASRRTFKRAGYRKTGERTYEY